MKFLLVAIFSVLIASASTIQSSDYLNGDNFRHFEKMLGCQETSWDKCTEYPGVYHFVARFFSVSPQHYFYFNLFLVVVAAPLFLYFLFQNEFFPITFLLLTNIPFYTLVSGTIPSFLVLILWAVFVKQKTTDKKIFLFLLSFFIHSFAPLLLVATVLLQELNSRIKKFFFTFAIPSPNFQEFSINPFSYFMFLSRVGSFTTYIIGVYELLRRQKFDYLFLVLASLVLGADIPRYFFLGVFILCLATGEFVESAPKNFKFFYFVFSLFFYFVNFTYLAAKV